MSAVPLPPRTIRGRFEPMTWDEAERWIASHAAWVEVWNRHECDASLPLGPEWAEGRAVVLLDGYPQSCLGFIDRATGRFGVMRFRRFRRFRPDWSFCRNAGSLDRLVWAGWRGWL